MHLTSAPSSSRGSSRNTRLYSRCSIRATKRQQKRRRNSNSSSCSLHFSLCLCERQQMFRCLKAQTSARCRCEDEASKKARQAFCRCLQKSSKIVVERCAANVCLSLTLCKMTTVSLSQYSQAEETESSAHNTYISLCLTGSLWIPVALFSHTVCVCVSALLITSERFASSMHSSFHCLSPNTLHGNGTFTYTCKTRTAISIISFSLLLHTK